MWTSSVRTHVFVPLGYISACGIFLLKGRKKISQVKIHIAWGGFKMPPWLGWSQGTSRARGGSCAGHIPEAQGLFRKACPNSYSSWCPWRKGSGVGMRQKWASIYSFIPQIEQGVVVQRHSSLLNCEESPGQRWRSSASPCLWKLV